MRSRVVLAGSLLVGTGGAVAAMTPGVQVVAIERSARLSGVRTADAEALCSGGQDRAARIELVPDALISDGGRERVEYHGEIAIERGTRVGVAWQADVVDDRGARVAQLEAGSFVGRAGNTASSPPLAAQLTDGFYAMRVRAAITADDQPATVLEAIQHVEVSQGRWIELTDDEWATRSRATQTFSAAELKARGL